MEDGIEQNINIDTTKSKNLIKNNNLIYLFVKDHSDWEDSIIINDKDKAIEYSTIKKCRIEIFAENEEGIYKPTYRYYKDGIYFINS
jgi:hypothetical protein